MKRQVEVAFNIANSYFWRNAILNRIMHLTGINKLKEPYIKTTKQSSCGFIQLEGNDGNATVFVEDSKFIFYFNATSF